MEDPISRTIESYERIGEVFTDKYLKFGGLYNIAEFFKNNIKGKNILDAGCGPGRDLKYFSEAFPPKESA